ncbi:MAG: PQQ-like beta-propeller repeat protein [Planctomycetales bacterium]|nr:PQQ-like beta-propeller repeat protein [Planctomycetales bacterium]
MSLSWTRLSAEEFADSDFRTWVTANGVRSTVKLRVVALQGSVAKLQREDGGIVELQLSRLSGEDLQYLRNLKRAGSTPVAALNSTTADGKEWPRWRGPENNGISAETGLLQKWPEDGPPLSWSASGIGEGFSSVVVWNERIYTLGKRGGATELICLSTTDGAEQWATAIGGGEAPNCTPTVDPQSKLVFGITHQGDLLCADAVTGAEKWRRNFARDFGGRMMSGWGYSESPLVDGELLICTPGSDEAVMAGLKKDTGEIVWKTPMPAGSAGYASPVVSQAGGIKQYVTLVGRGLIGVAADDGRLLWQYDRIANSTANVPTPIVHGDLVFGSSGYGDGGSALLRLHRDGNGIRAEEVYYLKNNQLQNHHGGMVRVGDLIYTGHGHNQGFPVCFDLKKGEPVWGPQRGPGSGSAAVLVADGKLYFRYQNGIMALLNASPNGYQVDGTFRVKSNNKEGWAHPVIADKKLYLRDQSELHCYDVARP